MLTIVLCLGMVACGVAALVFAIMLSPWCFVCIFVIPFLYVLFIIAQEYCIFPEWFLALIDALFF
jgi:hypothetical protein